MIMAFNPQQFTFTPDANKQAHYPDPDASQNADYLSTIMLTFVFKVSVMSVSINKCSKMSWLGNFHTCFCYNTVFPSGRVVDKDRKSS